MGNSNHCMTCVSVSVKGNANRACLLRSVCPTQSPLCVSHSPTPQHPPRSRASRLLSCWGKGLFIHLADTTTSRQRRKSVRALARKHPVLARASHVQRCYLTKHIHKRVRESQLPHKIVSFLFTITDCNIKLTVFMGDFNLFNW